MYEKESFCFGRDCIGSCFSSFTSNFAIDYYLVFQGGTNEKLMSNYAAPTPVQLSHEFGTQGPILNWFRVVDHDSNGVSVVEFVASFEIYDVVFDPLNKLSDEAADIVGQLDLRNKP
jgi:hypothetical protein